MNKFIHRNNYLTVLVCSALLTGWAAVGEEDQDATKADAALPAQTTAEALLAPATLPGQRTIVIQTIEDDGLGKHGREVAWLGLGVEESSEALSSQLGLKRGEGLTVGFLAAGSPAAKADFRKNDVLVELDGQMLVHPMQFRKLVQMHSEGDPINLTFYRGGKKQTISVKLGKTNWDEAEIKADPAAAAGLENLNIQIDSLNGDLSGLSQSLASAGQDKHGGNAEIERTLRLTRKAIENATRRTTTTQKLLSNDDQELEAVAREGVDVDKDATIIVRNKRNSNRALFQSDVSGDFTIEAGAKIHLTARNKSGKLLYDGDIDTAAEQNKVPKEVWEKVEPMYDKIIASTDGPGNGGGRLSHGEVRFSSGGDSKGDESAPGK